MKYEYTKGDGNKNDVADQKDIHDMFPILLPMPKINNKEQDQGKKEEG